MPLGFNQKPALTTSWCLSCWKLTSNQHSPCGLLLGLLHDVVGWKWLTRDWKVITLSARFGTLVLVGLTTKKNMYSREPNLVQIFFWQPMPGISRFVLTSRWQQSRKWCVWVQCAGISGYSEEYLAWRVFIAVPTSRFFLSKLKSETCRCGFWICLLKLTAPCIAATAKACAHGPFVLKDSGNHPDPGCTSWEASCGRCAWICFLRNLRFCRLWAVKVLQQVAGRSESHIRFQGNARRMLKQFTIQTSVCHCYLTHHALFWLSFFMIERWTEKHAMTCKRVCIYIYIYI